MTSRAAAKGRRLLPSVAVCVASTLLLTPAAANADALPLRLTDPTANEKVASGIFLSLGGCNVKRSLSLAVEKRWGNDYMHARYYSPNLGRFLSVDPVGGFIGSSQSWNRYSYSLNNPILFFDPDGRQEVTDLKPSVPSKLNPLKVFRGFWGNQVMMIDDSENKVQSAADLALEIAVISSDLLPSDSARAFAEIQSGQDRPNVRDPGEFKNDGRGGTQVLPTHDQQGNPIEYSKHTVNPRTPGVGLDDKRIVTGSDGSVYYTGDHYETWQKVEDDKEKEERKKQQGSQFHRIDDHAGEETN